ncbi:MAG: hypothetical protein M3544_09685, partial [Pseudomonadota bacterium]|nr:hypothetical protein [Pseudomonadota bacterium]
ASVPEIIAVVVLSITGIWFMCAAMTGYAMRAMSLPLRIGFGATGILLLMPFQASSVNVWLNVLGGVLGFGLLANEMRIAKGSAHVHP